MWYYIAAIQLLAGYGLMSVKTKASILMRLWIWLVPLFDIAGGYFLVTDTRPWYRMLVYIFLLFLGMKTVSAVYRYPGSGKLNFIQWLAYALAWPGMDPQPFEQLGKGRAVFFKTTFFQGLFSFVAGSMLLLVLATLLKYTAVPDYGLCILAFVPIVMIFHAGLFNLAAVCWGLLGVPLTPLMDKPWKSESVGSFWGKRWNIAFIQMTKITLFLPMARKGKAKEALPLSFFVSGVFHEVAMSAPVRWGYGMPMLYFILQAVFVLSERKWGLDKLVPLKRRIWTWLCILLPFPLLFHPAFAHEIVLPFLKNIGKIIF